MALPYVTDIIKNLDNYRETKVYLDNLTRDCIVDIRQVHESYDYTDDVTENDLYAQYAIFVGYFIRKHISFDKKINIIDYRTEWVINENVVKPKNLENCYDVFKNNKLSAINYIKEIQTVSYCNEIYFQRPFPDLYFDVDRDNMLDTVKYIDSLPYADYKLNPAVHSNYFNGHADIILNNEIIYHTKVSKFKLLHGERNEIPKTPFYQLILYSFGYYKRTNNTVRINKFLIYNPLLGYEYRLSVNEIDYEEFERALQHR